MIARIVGIKFSSRALVPLSILPSSLNQFPFPPSTFPLIPWLPRYLCLPSRFYSYLSPCTFPCHGLARFPYQSARRVAQSIPLSPSLRLLPPFACLSVPRPCLRVRVSIRVPRELVYVGAMPNSSRGCNCRGTNYRGPDVVGVKPPNRGEAPRRFPRTRTTCQFFRFLPPSSAVSAKMVTNAIRRIKIPSEPSCVISLERMDIWTRGPSSGGAMIVGLRMGNFGSGWIDRSSFKKRGDRGECDTSRDGRLV